jgi:hypothetical protein
VVTRSGRTNEPLQVFYSIHGTASNGLDYAAIPNSVVIPAGRWAAEIVIRPLPDDEVEGVERVALKLEAPVCITIFPPPPGCYQVGVPGEAVVSIADREPPANQPPLVRILKPVEGQTLCAPTNVLIVAETKDPDGYVPKVEFFANNLKIGGADKSFFVKPPPGEPIRYEFLWTNPPPGRHTLAVRATDDQGATAWADPVTIWIVNTNTPPPPPRVTITATDPVASEGTNCWSWQGFADGPDRSGCITNTATFVVRRFGPTNEALTVHYRVAGSASNGADYSELGGEVTIPAGRRAVPIVVVPMDDTEPECTETVLLALRVPPATITAVPPYLIGDPGRAAAIIVDNDRPRPVTGMLPDRCFHFMKPGRNGTWFRIECSTDMVHWTPLGTNCVTDGALHFVDLDTDGLPTRFYRAVPEDAPPVE